MGNTPKSHSFLRSVRNFFLDDFWRKAISLVLAALTFWAIKQNIDSGEGGTYVDVDLNLSDHDGTLYYPLQPAKRTKYRIFLRQKAKHISLQSGDFYLEADPLSTKVEAQPTINYPGSREQKIKIPLTPANILKYPAGVRIMRIEPPEAEIIFDEIETVTSKVTVPVYGKLRDGYTYMLSNVPEVEVKGPSRNLHPGVVIETEPITLDNTMTKDFTERKKIINRDSHLTISPEEVEIKIAIEDTKAISTRRFNDIPIFALQPPDSNLRLKSRLPKLASANLHGLNTSLKKLDKKSDELKAYIDLTRITRSGHYHVTVNLLQLPEGILRADWLEPSELDVELEQIPEDNAAKTEKKPDPEHTSKPDASK